MDTNNNADHKREVSQSEAFHLYHSKVVSLYVVKLKSTDPLADYNDDEDVQQDQKNQFRHNLLSYLFKII
ncbi:hypothetical protein PROPEN_02108 [Proteus penneri ATCC 35198]|nr:hypothetical protein PROPEN_02108 [Proteus penneri ATCC 35198]